MQRSVWVEPLGTADQLEPFHRTSSPNPPTAHALFAVSPQTDVKKAFTPVVIGALHDVPFHRMMVLPPPTTQTLFALVPKTPRSCWVTPLVAAPHDVPFQ